MRMALSATAISSNHLVAQNFNGNFLDSDIFIKSSFFAGASENKYYRDQNRLSMCHPVATAPLLKAP